MKPFCETVVADIMPALRALITQELMETYGLNQTQVASRLGITQPAVSQYRKELRGQNVHMLKSNEKVMEMVKAFSSEIHAGSVKPAAMMTRICEICKVIRSEGMICQLHSKSYTSLSGCSLCTK